MDPTPARGERAGGLGWLWWLLAVAVASVAFVALWRWRGPRRGEAIIAGRVPTDAVRDFEAEAAEEWDDDEGDDSAVMVLGLLRYPLKRIEGSGAVAAVRASLAYTIGAAGHDPEPERDRVLLVVARAETERLLPPDAPLPSWVRVVADQDTLFTEIEVAHLRFTRLREQYEQDRDAGKRPSSPPVPILTVVTLGPDDSDAWRRLRALHERARSARYAMTVVCIGGQFGPWVRVEADGRTTTSDETLPLDLKAWMFTEAEATARFVRDAEATAQARRELPTPLPTEPDLAPKPHATVRTSSNVPAVTVRLLGAYQITAGGTEVASGLRSKARELLAYLAVNRDGSTADAAIEALFPGANVEKGQGYFRTVLANLRTVLRSTALLADTAAVIERVGSRYRLDPRLVEVDVWDFEDSLAAAAQGDEAAASKAADSYTGEFAAGEDYIWAEAVRERLRRKAIDHLTALAERRRAVDDLDGALCVAEQAMEYDPYAEELYRTVMTLQRALGRGDAARRTYQLLERHLAELGLEPSAQTKGSS